jgi:Plasma-membrane choline transporter
MGLSLVAYGFLALAFAWSVLWFAGVGSALTGNQIAVVFVCFISYYWVHQVLQNTVHVTCTGVIGTWWFVPDEACARSGSCCSSALSDSFYRATTYSFGSICFGSFLVALVQALRALEHYTRQNDDCNMLSCVIQCILACIQDIIEVRAQLFCRQCTPRQHHF